MSILIEGVSGVWHGSVSNSDTDPCQTLSPVIHLKNLFSLVIIGVDESISCLVSDKD